MNFRGTIGLTGLTADEKVALKAKAQAELPDLNLYKGHWWVGTMRFDTLQYANDIIMVRLNADGTVDLEQLGDESKFYPI